MYISYVTLHRFHLRCTTSIQLWMVTHSVYSYKHFSKFMHHDVQVWSACDANYIEVEVQSLLVEAKEDTRE